MNYFFSFNRDYYRIGHSDIGPIALSDHGPIYMSICLSDKLRSTPWRLNSSILNAHGTKEGLKRGIETYLEVNDNGEVSPPILWEST